MPPITVGVSLKTYFGSAQARRWCATVAERVAEHPAVIAGTVELFVVPTYLQIHDALAAFAGTPVRVGAQDVSAHGQGAYTGEVPAAELAEVGVTLAEVGHAERRRLFGETDEIVAAKVAAALGAGLTPVLCIGETAEGGAPDAVAATLAQLRADLADAPAGPVIVAYEPVWAIGAAEPAPTAHIAAVASALRSALDAMPDRSGSRVVYGGSAGPGLLTELDRSIDGLFLGRFAHDPDNLVAVLSEAARLPASTPPSGATRAHAPSSRDDEGERT